MQRQAMIEEHIENNPGIAPPRFGKAPERLQHQRVAVSEHIDLAVQADCSFEREWITPAKWPFDEVTIEAAEQLFGLLAAQVKVCEIVHERSLAPAPLISL
ncbi:hypothetical protein D3C72_1864130 [compost metagenome]